MSQCDNCGLCCKKLIIEIDHVDVVREPKRVGIAKQMKGMYEEESPWDREYMLACGASMPCPMLGTDNLCQIYPTRPNVCVAFEAGSEQCNELREENGLLPISRGTDVEP